MTAHCPLLHERMATGCGKVTVRMDSIGYLAFSQMLETEGERQTQIERESLKQS